MPTAHCPLPRCAQRPGKMIKWNLREWQLISRFALGEVGTSRKLGKVIVTQECSFLNPEREVENPGRHPLCFNFRVTHSFDEAFV